MSQGFIWRGTSDEGWYDTCDIPCSVMGTYGLRPIDERVTGNGRRPPNRSSVLLMEASIKSRDRIIYNGMIQTQG